MYERREEPWLMLFPILPSESENETNLETSGVKAHKETHFPRKIKTRHRQAAQIGNTD